MNSKKVLFVAASLAALVLSGCMAVSVGTTEEQHVVGVNLAEGKVINETGKPVVNDAGVPALAKVVYEEDRYVSYVESSSDPNSKAILAYTFDKAANQKLTLDDVCPIRQREPFRQMLKKLIIEKIGAENVMIEPFISKNFYLGGDGWHFIYNPGYVADASLGVVEVVVLKGRPVGEL